MLGKYREWLSKAKVEAMEAKKKIRGKKGQLS
jgi:hypothetical protein